MGATIPGLVPKAVAKAMDPEQISEATIDDLTELVGVVQSGRQGASAFPPPLGTNRVIMGIAGGAATGVTPADDDHATITTFPSQFVFPLTKYRNEAFARGMSAGA